MQPKTWEVVEKESDLPFLQDQNIAEIKLVRITQANMGFADMLIGYDFHGNKLYEWQPMAVNIAYFPIENSISTNYKIDTTPLVIE